MIRGGHVQASFPVFFYSYLLFPIPFLFFPPGSLFISPYDVLCPPAALLQFSRCRICPNGRRVYAISISDLAPSQPLVMRGAGPQVQRLTPCLAPPHSGVELCLRTPVSELQAAVGWVLLRHLASSSRCKPFTDESSTSSVTTFFTLSLLNPSASLSLLTVRLLGQ